VPSSHQIVFPSCPNLYWRSSESNDLRYKSQGLRKAICSISAARGQRRPLRAREGNVSRSGGKRAKRGQLKWVWSLQPESHGQNLAVTVLHVPGSRDSGHIRSILNKLTRMAPIRPGAHLERGRGPLRAGAGIS